jgi:hypothetical protein
MAINYDLINRGGISLSANFELLSEKPLDARHVVPTFEGLQNYINNGAAYEGMIVFVSDQRRHYRVETIEGILSYRELTWTAEELKALIASETVEAFESAAEAIATEKTRASNTEAAIVGGASYHRSGNFEDYSWRSGQRTLSYRGTIVSTSATVHLKDGVDIQLTVDEDQLCYSLDPDIPEYDPDPSTNIPAYALYLVAKQVSEDESKVSFAEFTFIPGAKIPVNELALLGQSTENTYYIFNTLNYLTTSGDLDYNSQLGTVTTTVITSGQNQNSGWWLTEGSTDRAVSSLIDIEDALTTAYNELVTVDATARMDEDGILTINLDTLLTSKLSSFKL